MAAVAVGDVSEPPAVGRPRQLALLARRRRHARSVAAVLRGGGEDLAVDGEGDLLAVGRQGELLDLVAERAMLDAGGGGRAAERDRHLARLAGRGVERPHAEAPLERDRLAVLGGGWPQHASVLERRQRLGRASPIGADAPDVLRAAAIGHEVASSVAAPHRPRVLGAAARHRLIGRRGAADLDEPNLALVEMTVAVAPPLRPRVGARRDRDRVASRRRRREVLRRVAIGGHRHRRAAVDRDAIDVRHAGDVVTARREVHPLAVR